MEKGRRRLLLHHKLINISVHCAASTLNTEPGPKHPAHFSKLAALSHKLLFSIVCADRLVLPPDVNTQGPRAKPMILPSSDQHARDYVRLHCTHVCLLLWQEEEKQHVRLAACSQLGSCLLLHISDEFFSCSLRFYLKCNIVFKNEIYFSAAVKATFI